MWMSVNMLEGELGMCRSLPQPKVEDKWGCRALQTQQCGEPVMMALGNWGSTNECVSAIY